MPVKSYILIALSVFMITLHILRLIKLLFRPRFLRHTYFDFPTDKINLVFTNLIIILFFLVVIYLQIG
jgi:hypothetical protein